MVFLGKEQIGDPFIKAFSRAAGADSDADRDVKSRRLTQAMIGYSEAEASTFTKENPWTNDAFYICSRQLLRVPSAFIGAVLGGSIGRGMRTLEKSIAEAH